MPEKIIIFRQVDSIFNILDFIKKKVIQYQQKKLDEALSKIKFHTDMKKNLEQQVKPNNKKIEIINVKKEISFHNEMIDIWKNNAEKIKKELKKVDK